MSFRQRVWHMLTKGNQNPYMLLFRKFLFYGSIVFMSSLLYSKKSKSKLIFTFEKNQQNLYLLKQNPVFSKGVYTPTYFLMNGILQRFYKKYFETQPFFPVQQQQATQQRFAILQIPVLHQKNYKENPSTIVFLSGSQGIDNNMINLSTTLNRHGFRAVCLDVDDFYSQQRLENTLKFIKNKYPNSKLYGVGVQYGANLLLNYAGNYPQTFNGLASIGNPLRVDLSQKKIEQSNFMWKSLLYKDMLKGRIQKQIKRQKCIDPSQKNYGITKLNSLYQIDKYIYNIQDEQKLKKFKEQNSSIYSLKKLKTNTLLIQSEQDPFSISLQAQSQHIQNSKCIYVQTHRGGHNQWFQSSQATRWVFRPLIYYFKLLELKK